MTFVPGLESRTSAWCTPTSVQKGVCMKNLDCKIKWCTISSHVRSLFISILAGIISNRVSKLPLVLSKIREVSVAMSQPR